MAYSDHDPSVAAKEDSLPGASGEAGGSRQQLATVAERDGLSTALNPKSIAIIGASDDPNKIGGRPLLYLARFGYGGRVYPVNPTRAMVQGRATYPDVASLPEAPDLAVIATPGPQVPAAIDECARRGVRTAIVMASGFGETTDAAAIAAQQAIVTRARSAGMRIVGPNSQGLANFGSGAVASFSTMFLEVEPADGPVGIISQSGMMSVVPFGFLRRRGIGVRHAHATGNDADVSLAELAVAVVQDPAVRLLLLYLESIGDAAMLARAAAIARERDVPIVALKAGRTGPGKAAARSHTGALANEDRVVDAFFREHGIWRAKDVDELLGGAELYLKGWRPAGRRLAVVSNSGASCVMAADAAQDFDIDIATLDDSTVEALAAHLPRFATTTNPIDITAALLTNSALFGTILRILAEDRGFDMLLVALSVGVGYDVPSFARAAAEFISTAKKPLVVCTPQPAVAAEFRCAGVPVIDSQTQAIAALSQVARHAQLLRGTRPPRKPGALVRRTGETHLLDEASSLEWVAATGIAVVDHRLCATADEAVAAFRELGPRVAMKVCSATIPHKSDYGLIALDVASESDVHATFSSLGAKAAPLGVAEAAIIVARMEVGERELMLGAKIDPVFGAILLVGDGGRYVEAFKDTAVLLAPTSAEEVLEALQRLRIAPLLAGYRGDPPLDVEAFCAAAVRLGESVTKPTARIRSVDLNPVIVRRQGDGVVVVDALVERLAGAAKVLAVQRQAP